VLYRKRGDGRRAHEQGVFARFRYNDLKEDAGVCGSCEAMEVESIIARNLQIIQSCTNQAQVKIAIQNVMAQHDFQRLAREASAARAAPLKSAYRTSCS
jgi:hypothetical protein